METEDPRIEGKDPWKDYVYHQATGFGSTYNRSLPEHERARALLRPSDHPWNAKVFYFHRLHICSLNRNIANNLIQDIPVKPRFC